MLSRYARLKRTALPKRTKRVRAVRSKPRPGRLKGDDMTKLRMDCWERDNGLCQICGVWTDPELHYSRSNSFHMAHIKAKGRGGDSLPNVQTECGDCHRVEHNYGPSRKKPVPSKERA